MDCARRSPGCASKDAGSIPATSTQGCWRKAGTLVGEKPGPPRTAVAPAFVVYVPRSASPGRPGRCRSVEAVGAELTDDGGIAVVEKQFGLAWSGSWTR